MMIPEPDDYLGRRPYRVIVMTPSGQRMQFARFKRREAALAFLDGVRLCGSVQGPLHLEVDAQAESPK